MKRILTAMLMIAAAGCITHPPAPELVSRYTLGTPVGDSGGNEGRVYLGDAYHWYTCSVIAHTNNSDMDPDSPAYADIATNRWPAKRCHVELSLDGGSNYTRRIGYGVEFDSARVRADLEWSPPRDYTLLTTNAVLRAILLDEGPWPIRSPAMPYDIKPGCYPQSSIFPIRGATIAAPAAGSIQWEGESTTINWRQSGGGAVWDLYWMIPPGGDLDTSHWITAVSNVVEGVNTKVISLNVPPAQSLILVIQSQSDPMVRGYSGVFTVDP
jgi:hypothetical protein